MLNSFLINNSKADFKIRYRILIVILVFIALMIYWLSIKPTIVLFEKYKETEQLYKQLQNSPDELSKLKSALQSYSNNTISKSTQSVSNEISKYCIANNLKVSYPSPVKTPNGNLLIETNIFIITGSFHDIVRLIYFIEQENKIGKIISSHFEMKKNFEKRTQYLESIIYLQTIKKIEDEK